MTKETPKNSQVETINAEISRELSTESVGRALLATTFKGLNPTSMRQAIMEGMIRGYKFKDFLEKNVYAIPFGNGYSLITSIDHARKRGMRAGIIGKSAPTFEIENGEIVSCTVTVKRRIGQDIGEYTATVYFDEYSTGKNLWTSKPRTMLAKVAEMHALRMACPEELSQAYTEEEMEAEADRNAPRVPMVEYNVERKVPAADDEHAGSDAKDDMEAAYEVVLQQIIAILVELKEDVDTHAKIGKAIKKHTELPFTKDNYSNILSELRKKSPTEMLGGERA